MGLRRILVTGTGPLGCVPAELAQRGRNGNCAPELQQAAALFNPQLQAMLDSLNSEIGQNVFIGANIRQSNIDFISDPGRYGILRTFYIEYTSYKPIYDNLTYFC